jgi:hypothetical protein
MLTKCNHDNSFIVDKIFNRIAAMADALGKSEDINKPVSTMMNDFINY